LALYHQLSAIDDLGKENIQSILRRVKFSELARIMYYRWDSVKEKYYKFRPVKPLAVEVKEETELVFKPKSG